MDVNRLVESFLGQTKSDRPGTKNPLGQAGAGLEKTLGSLPSGFTGGAAAGGLMSLLMGSKKARKFGGKALTYGGLAVVGGLAYKAWSDYKAGRQGAAVSVSQLPAPPQNSAFDPASQRDREGGDLRLALLRAMIGAAKADGHLDQQENAQIQQQIQSMDLAADEKAFLFDQMNAPSDPIAIACLAQGEEQAAELYLASALAIDVNTPEERRYMERLGDALRISEGLRSQLDFHAEQAKASAETDRG